MNNHHYMEIEMNNQTWYFLDKTDRNEHDDIRMINYAKASLYHWRKSDKYTIIKERRGKQLISHVYAIFGKSDEALSYAKETLKITDDNCLKDFDLAYAQESMARAHSIAKNKIQSKEWYKKAKIAGNLIVGAKDREYFLLDLNSK